MVDWIFEFLIIIGRIVTIFPLVLLMTIVMGKRSIGELPVFDFLIVVSLGSVVGADIAEPDVNHLHTAVAIVAIGLLQVIIAKWVIKKRKWGRWITFEPTIVIHQGKLLRNNLLHIRYSIDNILQMLREQHIFDIETVELAIVEANGKLSVQKKANKETVTVEDMGLCKASEAISYPIIIEGKIYKQVLEHLQLSEDWLYTQLSKKEITDINKIFLATINQSKQLHISMDEEWSQLPPIEN